jgi:hypothetical protein
MGISKRPFKGQQTPGSSSSDLYIVGFQQERQPHIFKLIAVSNLLISARTETHYYELSQAVFKDFLKLLPVEFKLTKEI